MTIGSKFDLIIDIFVGFDLIIELNKVAPIPNIVGLGHPVKYFLLWIMNEVTAREELNRVK